jgi:polyphosphate kinase
MNRTSGKTSDPTSPPPVLDADSEASFLNRELTWLEFNRRVLHEALDERTPLMERVAFLAIFNSNLDEYFQKRVGGLKRQVRAGLAINTPDGLSASEQLTRIRHMVVEMLETQAMCFRRVIRPALAEQGVHLLRWDELSEAERDFCDSYFQDNLFSILTPLAVDPGHPFPFISNLSTSLGVMLRYPGVAESKTIGGEPGEVQFARVKVPRMLARWVRVDGGGPESPMRGARFIHLRQIIEHNLDRLFEGMHIDQIMPFRITRNATIERDEEDAEDLLDLIEQEVRDRRLAEAIRLEVPADASEPMVRFLTEELQLTDADVYHMSGELDYTDFWAIHALSLPQIKYPPWTPLVPSRLADDEADIYSVIRNGDVLVHHPYESFAASVERFIRSAVTDPKVLAIKLTLYRTSEDSPFIPELIRAAEAGKQVVVLVELKARFDEERNISVAQLLEKAGVHVVYGLVGLKTHTKTALVVRHEPEGMRAYAHIGTGNYNSKTAHVYTDLGLFTCDPKITGELVELFHYLTGRSLKKDFKHLLVAPINMKRRFIKMIEREIEHCDAWKQRGGDPEDPDRPHIIAKMNSLEDKSICRKLYEASNAGVRIELIVRGFCCLRPGVKGLSDHISVISVIGRFLEHSRIFFFHNNGDPEYHIGSADWMYRNLNNRVECIVPIYDPALRQRLHQILDILLADQRQAWDMQPDGSYIQRSSAPGTPEALGTQETIMQLTRTEVRRIRGK